MSDIVIADGGSDVADIAVAMAAAEAAVEAEQAAEEAEEAQATAEVAEAVAEAALEVAETAVEMAAGDSVHSHDEYVSRGELREIADAYVLELAALTATAEEVGEVAGEVEAEPEEDVAPPSIETPKKRSFRERYEGA